VAAVDREVEEAVAHDVPELEACHAEEGNRPEGLDDVGDHVAPGVGEDRDRVGHAQGLPRRDHVGRLDGPLGAAGGDEIVQQARVPVHDGWKAGLAGAGDEPLADHRVQARALRGQVRFHAAVDLPQALLPDQPARHGRLVSGNIGGDVIEDPARAVGDEEQPIAQRHRARGGRKSTTCQIGKRFGGVDRNVIPQSQPIRARRRVFQAADRRKSQTDSLPKVARGDGRMDLMTAIENLNRLV